ncbi:MAG: HlyD family efflux transporter periplasmic adaptor subunit [Fuerstiella sp.]
MPQTLNIQTPDTDQPVVTIPAPITHSIDQLLQAIAQHQHSLPIDPSGNTAAADVANTGSTNQDGLLGSSESPLEPAAEVSQHLAALIDMVNRLHGGMHEETASRQLVRDLAAHLSMSTATEVVVSLAMVDEITLRCNVVAASDMVHLDQRCEKVTARQSAAQEAIARSAVSVWPISEASKRHALLAQEQLAEVESSQLAVSAPFELADGRPHAVVVCSATWQTNKRGATPEKVSNDVGRFLNAAAEPLATALEIRNQLDRSWWAHAASKIRKVCLTKRHQLIGAIFAVSGAVMLIPMDYKVTCQVELQPVLRRFVASPFAAQLNRCLVEPGDIVQAGQLLAVLEGREIQWELSGILSDLEKAKKERNTYLSERSYGLAAIARHEAQRMQNKASLLQDRLSQLEIRSPIDGVIVAGDLKDTEGAPLETGQSLFEVAPLDRMKVHIGVPEDDIRHVTKSMLAVLQLDAMPSESLETQLDSIRPTAEIFEDDNVFIAEAEMDNSDRLLRPGMRGQAKVSTGKQPLGWNLFHKPTAWLVGWLRW